MSGGAYYWDTYENCSDDLKMSFNNELPDPFPNSIASKRVQKRPRD